MRERLAVWARLVTATAIAGSVALASFATGTGTGAAVGSLTPQTVAEPTLTLAASTSARVTTTSASPVTVPFTFDFTTGYFANDRNVTATVTVSGTAPGSLHFDATDLDLISTSTHSAGTVLTLRGTTTSVTTALTGGRVSWLVPEQPGQVTLSATVRQDLPADTFFNPSNGHFYQRVTTTRSWDNAQSNATTRELFGLTGYLVTITSEVEQNFVASLVSANEWWIGATDRRVEGVWEWVTGPEGEANGGVGTIFWAANSQSRGQRGTVTVSGTPRFAWWDDGNFLVGGDEPNSFLLGEDLGVLKGSNGRWKDDDSVEARRALVEFGLADGNTADRSVVTFQTTLTAISRLVDIIAYADGTNGTAPDAAEWAQAMVTGVDTEAFATSLATALASTSISGQHVDTSASAQALVDSYRRILDHAGDPTSAEPTAADYEVLGFGTLDDEVLSRLHTRMAANGPTSVDTYGELATRVTEAQRAVVRLQELMAYADTDSGTPPDAPAWTEAMVNGVDTEAFATSLATVLASARVTGASVSSITLAQSVADSYRRVLDFSASRGSSAPPTVADYERLGLGTMPDDVLRRMNFRVAVTGLGLIDTFARLDALLAEALIPPAPIVLPPASTTSATTTTTVPATTTTRASTTTTTVPAPAAPPVTPTPEPSSTPPTATTTPVAPSAPTVAPVVEFADGRPVAIAPGNALLLADGREVTLQISPRGASALSVTGGDIALTLAATNPQGEPRPLSTDGTMTVAHDDRLTVTGNGFGPLQPVEVWAFSTPLALGATTTDAQGVLSVEVAIPQALEPGAHTLQLVGLDTNGSIRAVSLGITVTPAQANEPITTTLPPPTTPPTTIAATSEVSTASEPSSSKPEPFSPYSALDSPEQLVATAVTAVAVLAAASAAGAAAGAAGAAGRAGGGSAGSSADSSNAASDEVGYVEAVGSLHLEAAVDEAGTGWQWLARWPGTRQLDGATRRIMEWSAPRSPLLERLVGDASTWRALFGSASLVLPVVGIGAGIAAALEVGGEALPPGLALMTVLMVVGTLDAFAGAAGFAVIAVSALLTGGIDDTSSVRTLLGLAAAFTGPGLVAKAFRPLRRPPHQSAADWWERATDLAVGPLMAGLVAQGIVWGLNGMAGVYLPITDYTNRLALWVMAALALQVIAEVMATHWFPARVRAVTPDAYPEPSTRRQVLSVVVSVSVYAFVVVAFLGNVWQLWAAVALFGGPTLLGFVSDRFPNIPPLWRVLPQGVPYMVVLLWGGVTLAGWVEGWLGDTSDYARTSFVLLAAFPAIFTLLALVGREPAEGEVRWNERPSLRYLYRLGGVATLWMGIQISV
jgi:hypothetical protein